MRKLIYLADDDASARISSVSTLRAIGGYDIREFEDGLALKEAYDSARPDLIITDNEMPGLTGIGFITYAREKRGDDIPIILMSGKREPARLAEKYNFKFFLKPFFVGDVVDFINEHVWSSDQVS